MTRSELGDKVLNALGNVQCRICLEDAPERETLAEKYGVNICEDFERCDEAIRRRIARR